MPPVLFEFRLKGHGPEMRLLWMKLFLYDPIFYNCAEPCHRKHNDHRECGGNIIIYGCKEEWRPYAYAPMARQQRPHPITPPCSFNPHLSNFPAVRIDDDVDRYKWLPQKPRNGVEHNQVRQTKWRQSQYSQMNPRDLFHPNLLRSYCYTSYTIIICRWNISVK